MIQMPRRSVTRFFIPLIDVLLLLFGIFLLMPIAADEDLEKRSEEAAQRGEAEAALQLALQDRLKELYKLEELRSDLDRVAELKQENQQLRNLMNQSIQESLRVKVIEADPKTGEIFYVNAGADQPLMPIRNEQTARELIAQNKKEAGGKNVYYQFLQRSAGYPTRRQADAYRRWFADVPNSLKVQP